METSKKMKDLLKFIDKNFMWLLSNFDFKIVDSEYYESFGGQGSIRLENSILCIDLISDRHQAYLEFSPIEGWNDESTSFDIIKQILTNEICDDSIISEEQIRFLRDNFKDILSLFSSTNKNDTLKKVKILEEKRGKRLFG